MTKVATGVSKPAGPWTFLYSPQAVPLGYQGVVLGRDPQNYPVDSIKAADADGTIIGIYLDFTVSNATGKYHGPLMQGVTRIPGGGSNAYGYAVLIDDAHLARIQTQLDRIAADFSYLKHPLLMADDAGADNWVFYESTGMTSAQRQVAYDGQLAAAKLLRAWADEHGWLIANNAEWRANRHHGFPNPDLPGCALYDFTFIEHHDSDLKVNDGYWDVYLEHCQANLHDAAGKGMHVIITSSSQGSADAQTYPDCAFVAEQPTGSSYANPGPKRGTKRDLGIPFGAIAVPPPDVDPDPDPTCEDQLASAQALNLTLQAQVSADAAQISSLSASLQDSNTRRDTAEGKLADIGAVLER